MHVAGKVEVNVLHRYDLCIAAARCTALDAEDRAEGRFTQCDDCILSELCHCLTQTDGRGGLALACRGGIDCGHENQLAVRLILNLFPGFAAELCLVLAVKFQIICGESSLCGNLRDGLHFAVLRDLDICQHCHSSSIVLLWDTL